VRTASAQPFAVGPTSLTGRALSSNVGRHVTCHVIAEAIMQLDSSYSCEETRMRMLAGFLIVALAVGSVHASPAIPKKGNAYLAERAQLELKYEYINTPVRAKQWRIAYSEISFVPVVIPFSSGPQDNFVAVLFGLKTQGSTRGVEVVYRVCPDGEEQVVALGSVNDFIATQKHYRVGPNTGYDLGECPIPEPDM